MVGPDASLMARIAGGDRGAFGELYDRHSPRIFGLLLRRLRNRSEAEDVLQDTFAQIWSRAGQYDPQRGEATAWMVRIALSRAVDHIRRRPRSVDPAALDPGAISADAESVDRAEMAGHAGRALSRLPEIQRELIRLSFFEGWTHEQIARERTLPLGTVKTHIRRGMQQLRDLLVGNRCGEAV